MKPILFKPNPILDGIFKDNNSNDYFIFNYILYNIQSQKANDFITIITKDNIKKMINDKNIATVEKINNYLNENFRKETIKWTYKHKKYTTGLITAIVYDSIKDSFIISVHKDLVEFLLNYDEMKTGYTPLNLGFKSKNFYATKIYEHLRKWSGNKNSLNISIIELRELLGVENKYNDFKVFNRDLLKPAIKEIEERFNMEVTFKTIKSGYSVTAIEFTFKDNEPRQYNFNDKDEVAIDVEYKEVKDVKEVDPIQNLLKSLNIKIAVSTTEKLKKQYGEDLVLQGINILHRQLLKGKIKAPVKYLTGIINNLHNEIKQKNLSERGSQLKFNDFESRMYDFDSLEDALLYGLKDGQNAEEVLRDLRNKVKDNE